VFILAVARSELVHFRDDLFHAGALDLARHEAEPSALSFSVALVAGVALQSAPIAAHQPRPVIEAFYPTDEDRGRKPLQIFLCPPY
jgi:hypothetical protein